MSTKRKNENKSANGTKPNVIDSIYSMKKVMNEFLQELQEIEFDEPSNDDVKSDIWAYRIAMSQFNNRFNVYCQ